MATLSSPGIGSGLDVNGIVTQLMALERRPIDQLGTATERYETQLSAFGKLQSSMSTLRDAARKLTDASNWTPSTVTSADPLSVTATSTGQSPPGSYSVSVSQLAAAQTLTSGTYAAATDNVGSGTLTIELGSWGAGQTSFTADPDATAVTLTIPPTASTLADIRDAINAAGAGVSASIVNDATGARLALRSTTTGEANAFRISVVEGDGDGNGGIDPGLGNLAFDPSNGVAGLTQTLAAANANATINGVVISTETNTLTDVLDGLTIKLGRVTAAAVDVGVTRDDTVIRKSITDFATAYNDLVKLNREQTRYDEGTKSAGTLQGDRSAVGLLSSLRSLVGSTSGATTSFTRLSDIGLEPQSDGSLKVNDTKLTTAMTKLPELKTFFSRSEAGTSQDGFGVLLREFGDGTLATDGVLTTRQEGLKERISRNAEVTERMEGRLELVERRLRERYTRLDTSIAQLNGLQNYVTQQIANWNSSSS
jgi:flagellar hook-associated protein 2